MRGRSGLSNAALRLTLEGVLGFKGVTPQENLWPGADEVFEILEWFFGVIYTLEVVFKLCVLGPKQFCLDLWNWMDTTIVLVWVISKATVGDGDGTAGRCSACHGSFWHEKPQIRMYMGVPCVMTCASLVSDTMLARA
eukprot:g19614.t1